MRTTWVRHVCYKRIQHFIHAYLVVDSLHTCVPPKERYGLALLVWGKEASGLGYYKLTNNCTKWVPSCQIAIGHSILDRRAQLDMNTHIHAHAHTRTHARTHTRTHSHSHTHTHAHTHTRTYSHSETQSQSHSNSNSLSLSLSLTHTHTHTHTHMYILRLIYTCAKMYICTCNVWICKHINTNVYASMYIHAYIYYRVMYVNKYIQIYMHACICK